MNVSPAKKLDAEHLEHKLEAEHVEDSGPRYVSISNPLADLTRQELLYQVDNFVESFGLQEDRALIKRGALLAQHHENWEEYATTQMVEDAAEDKSAGVPDEDLVLSEEELAALRFERDNPWKSLSWSMLSSAIVCAFSAWTQGGDQQSNSAAVLTWPRDLGIDGPEDKYQWIQGLVSSGPYFGAFLCSVWLSDVLNHYLGRRGTLATAAIFCIAAPIGSAGCKHWYQLFIVRILLGLGIGFKEVTSPVYAAENSPTPVRGAMTMFWQFFTAFGIAFHAGINIPLGPANLGMLSWRYELAFAALPALLLASTIYLCPESPRWLISRGKIPQAWKSLKRLRYRPINASRDFYLLYVQLIEEEAVIGQRGNYFKRFFELFYKKRIRQASLAAFVVMISQQMCGINVISFYAGTIFQEVSGSVQKALWASFGFGLVNWVFAIPGLLTIDKFGRRTLLLFTFPIMFTFLLAAGLCTLIHDSARRVKLGLVSLFIYLFTAFYSPGAGPVPFTYSAEIYPISHREVGMAWGVFINNFFATVLSITWFRIRAVMTLTGAFGFYAGLNLVAWVWIILFVPETKQLSLEDLDTVFSVPTHKFTKWALTKEIPYYVNRYVFWRDVQLKPFDRVDHFVT